jgi:GrpB-like predicted nucleotidyltransferase (UPF0157 family)
LIASAKKMKIILEKYNPDWKNQFETEKLLIIKTLSDLNIKIEHIGSTSIEGLRAKPIIDIMIGLENFDSADNQIGKIEKLGYQYISKYEDIMPFRRFFIKKSKGHSTHHIHMVEYGSEFWMRHLRFRDHLRMSMADRDRYDELKKELVKKDWIDGNEYADAKSEFIKRIERNTTTTN